MRIPLFLAVVSLVGCATDVAIEDGENDVFLTQDAKSDAFGVEDWSPDGAAVLKLASTASASKLRNTVGLSARVVDGIVAKRAELGGPFTDLAELDAAKYVGVTVFQRMLRYVADNGLFPASLRIPLLIDDGNGNLKAISSFNTLARTFGKQGFARYTFVNIATPFNAKMDRYDERLAELGAVAGVTIGGEMVRYARTLGDFELGTQRVCFIGKATEVPRIADFQYNGMMREMYTLWGWRYKSTKWTYDPTYPEAEDEFGDDWSGWDTDSDDLLMITSHVDGDAPTAEVVPPCR